MNKREIRIIALLIIFILLKINILNAQDTIKVESKVNKVVVFLKGAQINRTAKCYLIKGKNLINFTKLSCQVVDKSIQIKSDTSVAIQSINFRINHLDSLVTLQKISTLQARKENLENEKLELENTIYVLKNEEELLKENQVLGGEKKTMKTEDLEKACTYYHDRLLEIITLKNKDQSGLVKIEVEKASINKQLEELNSKKDNPVGEVWVVAYAQEAGEKQFTIEYFINDAGWTPKYDIRAESVNKPAILAYRADVYQNTDDDWSNVQMVLSSSNPSLGGTKPELTSWYLNVNEDYSYSGGSISYNNSSSYNNSVNYYEGLKNDYSSPINVDHDMTITGTVADGNGGGLIGVSIIVKGTPNGAVTDLEGKYSIQVPAGSSTLSFMYIGYKSEELPITGPTVNCVLQEDVSSVQEVVVIGYGTSKKNDLTGSVTTLVNDGNGNFVDQALQGRCSGVSIEPLRIRGMGSLRHLHEPKKKLIGKTLTGLNKVKENQTSVEFQLDKPYTIPSDNKNYSVDIEKYEIPVHFQYSTVPKMDPSAFLLAQITDWAELNLLSGNVNIYFEGSYIGNSTLDVQKTNDTLDISMGRDKAIVIDRKLKENSNKKLGKSQTYTWEITVKNTKNDSINVNIEDQIPLTYSKDFEIELLESQNAEYNKDKGELKWVIDLAPQKKKILTFSYQVKAKK